VIDGSALVDGLPTAAGREPRAGRIVEIASGPLQVRLARDRSDIDAAQALRYRVFYECLGARAAVEAAVRRRDFDRFDENCDHLLVIDRSRGDGPENVVGTYRLIRREAAARLGGFYSAAEFDIAPLAAYPGEILELGRSCVDGAYRQRPTMQLLWSGIAAYAFHYDIALMFGCASLPGTDPDALAMPLSYLHYHHLAPSALRARALPRRYVAMRRLPARAIDAARARAHLPPLIKGYLRLGGFVGDGAVIDRDFNTTDVCIVVKTDLVTEKYSRHYVRQTRDPKENWAGGIWAS
jgi:putative hemolysin